MMPDLQKPADCTCEYPRLIARNMCGHTPPCPVYVRWKAELDQKRPERKERVLYVSPELWLEACKAGTHPPHAYEVIRDPVPQDARPLRCFYSEDRRAVGIVIESAEFDPVPDGEQIPAMEPLFVIKLAI